MHKSVYDNILFNFENRLKQLCSNKYKVHNLKYVSQQGNIVKVPYKSY